MMKKRLAVVVLAVMILSLCAACGTPGASPVNTQNASAASSASSNPQATTSQPESIKPLFDKPVTISLLMAAHSTWPYNKDWYIVDLVKRYTNADLDVTTVVDENGAFFDKVSVTIASGDVPDLIYPIGLEIQQKFNNQGVFANIKDHLDITPNFKKFLEENKDYMLTFTSADGKVYQFPSLGMGESNRRGWLYRKDIFEKNGIKPPTTSDELYAVCKQLKQLYPDSYPYVARDHDLLQFLMIAPSWGTDFHSPTTGYFRYDPASKDFFYGPITDNFKQMVVFYNKLYKEGLINPNFLTATTSEWESLVTSEKGYITVDYLSRIDSFDAAVRPTNPDFTLAYMDPVKGGTGGVGKFAASTTEYYGFLPFAGSKHLDDILKYCDWYYTDQAKELISWGEKDVTYTVQDGQKKFKDADNIKTLRINTGVSTSGFYTLYDFDAQLSLSSKDVKDAYTESKKFDLPLNPNPPYNDEELQWINTQGAGLMKYVEESISKFILGTRNISEWDKYVQDVKDLGLDKFKEIVVTAYTRATTAN